MNELILPCATTDGDSAIFEEYLGFLAVCVEQDANKSVVHFSPESEARLYEFLSKRRSITPPADAITRIAVASERTAVELEKLASFATADGFGDDTCDHGYTMNCPGGCN